MPTSDILSADSIDEFGRLAQQILSTTSKSRPTRSRFCPRLSYGRHRGPARIESRQAAVVIVVYPHQDTGRLCLTLTRRPSGLSHHGGQVCLPGGRIEAGESALHAALREYHEELGVEVKMITAIGQLPPLYVFASDNWVQSWVVTSRTPVTPWQPDPAEVDEVIEMPLDGLISIADLNRCPMEPDLAIGHHQAINSERAGGLTAASASAGFQVQNRKKIRSGKDAGGRRVFDYGFACRTIEFLDLQGQRCEIWGATAMLIDWFANLVYRVAIPGERSAGRSKL